MATVATFVRRRLLGVGTDAKTVKGALVGFLTGILYLAPHRISGRQVCPMASIGCAAACLFASGRGVFPNVRAARISKTDYFFDERAAFSWNLAKDITALVRKAARDGLTAVVRLNGTSDIRWERIAPQLFVWFPKVQFYDYTKRPGRVDLPSNYHLTFSRSEENDAACAAELATGRNVAVVFSTRKGEPLPDTWTDVDGHTWPVLDGDVNDVRHLDPTGHIVGLRAKGPARHDQSGFVVDVGNALAHGAAMEEQYERNAQALAMATGIDAEMVLATIKRNVGTAA